MNTKKLTNYLSKDIIDKLSFHVSKDRDEEGVYEDVCLLNDGTLITISTTKNGLTLPNNFLLNPNEIVIQCDSMVIIKFKESEDKDKFVRFKVSSITDLESQWKKYRDIKGLGDIYGTISEITMTPSQMDDCSRIFVIINQFLNIVMKERIEIFSDKTNEKCIERADIIKYLVPKMCCHLIQDEICKSLYCPTIISDDETGATKSIREIIDAAFIREQNRKMRGEEDESYFDEEEFYEYDSYEEDYE